MDKHSNWTLSPAFDLTYSFDPTGRWTSTHQIMVNGKQDEFTRDDLITFGALCNLQRTQANKIIDAVITVFQEFEGRAKELNVDQTLIDTIVYNRWPSNFSVLNNAPINIAIKYTLLVYAPEQSLLQSRYSSFVKIKLFIIKAKILKT